MMRRRRTIGSPPRFFDSLFIVGRLSAERRGGTPVWERKKVSHESHDGGEHFEQRADVMATFTRNPRLSRSVSFLQLKPSLSLKLAYWVWGEKRGSCARIRDRKRLSAA